MENYGVREYQGSEQFVAFLSDIVAHQRLTMRFT